MTDEERQRFSNRLREATAEIERLRAAAERVCRFDWSGNDNDALVAVDALRRTLEPKP